MTTFQFLLFAAGGYPVYRAWRANRYTSLFHAVHWGAGAWLAWGIVLADVTEGHPNPATYTALCLTAAAGVAVLGARRPQVGAWNFVVVGLLAVMLLPLVEMWVLRVPALDVVRGVFLAVTLAVGVVNYLPTRFGPAAFLLGLGCAGELIAVLATEPLPRGREEDLVRLCWLSAPWVALGWVGLREPTHDLNEAWLNFRDRWGLVWAQRVREQFNRSAVNNDWPVTLSWFGFRSERPVAASIQGDIEQTFFALLKRFIEVR